jgi:hypothetical protein
MLQKALGVVFAARLVLAPWADAQEPVHAPGSIAAAAAREAARTGPAESAARGPMPNGPKWTGIGLILAGGATVFSTAIGNCGSSCGDRATGYLVGGAEFAVGSLLLGLADRHRAPSPTGTTGRSEPEPSIRAAAEREATRSSSAGRGPMPGGLKWTGIGLLAGSPLPIAITQFSDCIPEGPACAHERRRARVAAGLLAGTGGLLLVIGEAKRGSALPSVSLEDGRAAIVQRVTF